MGYELSCRLPRLGQLVEAGKGVVVVMDLVNLCNGCCVRAASGVADASLTATKIKTNKQLVILDIRAESKPTLGGHLTFDGTKKNQSVSNTRCEVLGRSRSLETLRGNAMTDSQRGFYYI